MRSSVILPLVALAFRFAAALPPACLLHAVNTADDPADISTLCGNDAEGIQQAIFDLCAEHEDTAQEAFIATCSAAGTSVAAFTPAPSSSGSADTTRTGTFVYTTASYNSDCDCTSTAIMTASASDATATGLTTATATGASGSGAETASGTARATNTAAPNKQLGSGFAAVVALAGVVAVL